MMDFQESTLTCRCSCCGGGTWRPGRPATARRVSSRRCESYAPLCKSGEEVSQMIIFVFIFFLFVHISSTIVFPC